MKSSWRPVRVLISVLILASMLLQLVPFAHSGVVLATTAPRTFSLSKRPLVLAPEYQSDEAEVPVQQTELLTYTLYLPMVGAAYTPPAPIEAVIEPGVGGRIGSLDGKVIVIFHPQAVTQTVIARYTPMDPPALPPDNLAVGGPAFDVSVRTPEGAPAHDFPPLVTIVPGPPDIAIVTPTVEIHIHYTPEDVWGLNLNEFFLYTRDDPSEEWQWVPSAAYQEQQLLVAEVDHFSQFVPLAPLAGVRSLATWADLQLALDPDDNVGWAYWPGVGKVTETPMSFRLIQETRQRFVDHDCHVDILVTRNSPNQSYVSRNLRAQMARNFGADLFATLTFNALQGAPWGWSGDGGMYAWPRSGNSNDAALANEFYPSIREYTGRPARAGRPHPVLPYAEFSDVASTYLHVETLFLDHNYDWPVINTAFNLIVDATYAALAKYMGEHLGLTCGEDNQPPPLPAPPSEAELKRLRDLGYQNYQRYGADPVSFSTGNHIVQVRLARIPARGGLDWNFTLTYNSQDPRADLLGYGWSLPYTARAQRYSDESVSIALWDGRTYHYTWNGSGYDAPAGVFDRLERTAEGWQWITPNEVTLVFHETVGGFGVLTEWRDRNSNALHFTYDLSGQDNWEDGEEVPRPPLTAIRDGAGRTVTVQSDAQSRITRLTFWDGRWYSFTYSAAGDLTRIADREGTLRRLEYDARHRMTKEWDAEDVLFLQSTYDDRDRVIAQVDASGTRSYLAYDVASRTTTFTDNLGNQEVYQWDELNRVTAEQDGGGNRTQNAYDADFNLITRTDPNGNTTRYEYDASGNLVARHDPIPAGVTYTEDVSRWTYNDRHQVTSRTDALDRTWIYDYDAAGNLIRAVAPDGSATTATYNTWGQPASITDALNRTTTYEYDGDGNLVKITYPDGTFSTSTYDTVGRELSYTDANGHTVHFVYNARDNITRIVDPKGASSIFEYDGNDLLIRSVDRRGAERRYEYDENLKLTGERDPLALWTRYGYDANYRRTVMTDTAGFVTRYVYDEAGFLISITDPIGAMTRYTYDANGNITAITNALGHTTRLIYDAANRLKFLMDANGNRTEYCYDAEDQLIRTIGPRGEVTDYTYDALGRLIAVKDPLGNITRYEYDAAGQRRAIVDPLGRRTDYGYDLLGRLARVERPALVGDVRPTMQFGYDAVGNTTVITSPLGFVTRFMYDANDNVVAVTDPLGGQVAYTYDAEDTPISVTDANGHTETTTYNLAGLPVQFEDALGYLTTLEFDDAYNLTRLVNAMGQATTYDYDPLGRLLQITDPLGHLTTYTRDALGRVTAFTDANGHTTEYGYDPLGQLIRVTDALSGTTAYAYNEVGSLTVITDANGSATTFSYNFLNQLTRETNPLGNSWWYAYDAAGQLIRRVDALWQATYYDYDSNGRLSGIRYGATPETMHPTTFTYDLEGRETQMCDGLLALSGVEGGCTTHTYDALGRPTSTTDWLGRTITRTYDAASNLTGLTYPNGFEVGYAYNANDWLTTFTDPRGDSSTFGYNALGQATFIHHANGTRVGLAYDPAGRLLALINRGADMRVQSAYRYAMDAVGNRVQVVEERAPFDGVGANVIITHTYAYDPLDRLIGAATEDPASNTNYAFDAVGNRLSKTGTVLAPDAGVPALPVAPAPEQVSYAYNAANQLTEIAEPGATTTLAYNANGDRIRETEVLTDGTTLLTEYRYDREDRLVGVTKSISDSVAITVTMVATYTYDGYGRRALKEVIEYTAPITPHVSRFAYLYDGLDIIGVTLEANETVTETYYYLAPSPITGMRRPFEMERLPNAETGFAGDRHWYQLDGLDSVVALTDESGEISDALLYEEYGQQLVGMSELQVFAYTGQDYDVETGLYHFYARYYDARFGVWLMRDDVVTPCRGNYQYVDNNPVTFVDVLGYLRLPWDDKSDKIRDSLREIGNEIIKATGRVIVRAVDRAVNRTVNSVKESIRSINNSLKASLIGIREGVLNWVQNRGAELLFGGYANSLLDRHSDAFCTIAKLCFPNDVRNGKALMKAIVYDEQIHLIPPVIEDSLGGDTVGLGQVSFTLWGEYAGASSRDELRTNAEINLKAVAIVLLDANTNNVRDMIEHYNPGYGNAYGRIDRIQGYYRRYGGNADSINTSGTPCKVKNSSEISWIRILLNRLRPRYSGPFLRK